MGLSITLTFYHHNFNERYYWANKYAAFTPSDVGYVKFILKKMIATVSKRPAGTADFSWVMSSSISGLVSSVRLSFGASHLTWIHLQVYRG